MTNERAIQILENLISINGDIIIGDEGREALEMAVRSLQQEQQEEPDKSLEEEANDYCSLYYDWDNEQERKSVVATFKAGAEWQKSQMLKDAYVESQIVEDGRIELGGDPLPCLNPIILLPYPQFKLYDKVRIIVLKEEE